MPKRRWIDATLLFIVVLGHGAQCDDAEAHQFTFALTSIELNPATGTLEVIHRLFTHDIEPALEAAAGRNLDFDDAAAVELQLREYTERRFSIADLEGIPLPLAWVGFETDGDKTWIYQEAAYDPSLHGLRVRSEFLFDYNASQVNNVNVLIGDHRKTLVFTEERQTLEFDWNQ